MVSDHEVLGVISAALAAEKVEPPPGEVGLAGNLDDIARAILDALADAGYKLVRD